MRENFTPNWQRIVIAIIAIVMILGTIAGLVFMIWSTQDRNASLDAVAEEEYLEQLQLAQEEYKQQMAELRKSYRGLDGYADRVTSFDAAAVTGLTTEVLKEGSGATISADDTVEVNYAGWTPDGQIFDSTKSEGSDAAPAEFALSDLVEGWAEGLSGQKVGGVYLLTIPADKAYGEYGSPDGSIAPNTPIRFMIEVIDIVTE